MALVTERRAKNGVRVRICNDDAAQYGADAYAKKAAEQCRKAQAILISAAQRAKQMEAGEKPEESGRAKT